MRLTSTHGLITPLPHRLMKNATQNTLPPEGMTSELQALRDTQEAEALLFQYVMTSACQIETPPVILKKLASNLGDPQRLPATQLLQTMGHTPLSHPLSTLIALEGILDGNFDEVSIDADSGTSDQERSPWISIDYTTPHSEYSKRTSPSQESNGIQPPKKQKLFPAGRIFLLGIALIYGYLVYTTGTFSPMGILEHIQTQRAVSRPNVVDIIPPSQRATETPTPIAPLAPDGEPHVLTDDEVSPPPHTPPKEQELPWTRPTEEPHPGVISRPE